MKKTIAVLAVSMTLVACVPPSSEGVGTVAGGVVGGLLGNQIGGGSGKVAATIAGSVLGAIGGSMIGRTMDTVDQLKMQNALESAPTGQTQTWKNPDSGYQYSVKPTRTYQQSNQPCREYVTTAMIGGKEEKVYGKACRKADGTWKIVN